jgi:predicted amidohydrolase YtcJ
MPNYKDKLSIRSTKIMLDGALGSRGAALLESTAPNNTGLLMMTPDEFTKEVQRWLKCGFQGE